MADTPTDDNSNLVDMDNLENFEKSFFGQETAVETDEDEEVSENGDDTPANEDDTEAQPEEEPDEDEDLDEEEEEEAPEPQKKGKKSAKERIEELYAANKQKERELAELRIAVEALKTPKPEVTEPEAAPKPVSELLPADAPHPDALDKDGERLYPLGEFDPKFIRDITRFTIAQERAELKAAEEKEAKEKATNAAQQQLASDWSQKVEEVEKELPDLREKLSDLTNTFSTIEPAYGDFLAATIMTCDYGPQIMYYLSQNIGEAQKIVASGPAAATLAIGRLDAKFNLPASDKRNKKVSTAPKPAEVRTRGSGSRTTVALDTNDLNAFEREFYKK